MRIPAFAVLLSALFLLVAAAVAQDARNDQADVWAVVEEQWDADEKGEREWTERLLTEDFSGWDKDSPAPRNRASTGMWDRFSAELGASVAHELYPLSIVVHGDVAVAHYLYTSAFRKKDGETELTNGRYTDVLVRTADGWRFLSWHGGDD